MSTETNLQTLINFEQTVPTQRAHINSNDRSPLEVLMEAMYDPSKYKTRREYIDDILHSFSRPEIKQKIATQDFINQRDGQPYLEVIANMAMNIYDKNSSIAYIREKLLQGWIEGTMRVTEGITQQNSRTNLECDLPRGIDMNAVGNILAGLQGIAEYKALKDTITNTVIPHSHAMLAAIRQSCPEYEQAFLLLLGSADLGFTLLDMVSKLNIVAQSSIPMINQTTSNVATVATIGTLPTQSVNSVQTASSIQQTILTLQYLLSSLPSYQANVDHWNSIIQNYVSVDSIQDIIRMMSGDDLSIQDAYAATIALQLLEKGISTMDPQYVDYWNGVMMLCYYFYVPRNANVVTDDQKRNILQAFNSITGMSLDTQYVPAGNPTLQDVIEYDFAHGTRKATVWYATATGDQQLRSFALDRFTPQGMNGYPKLCPQTIWNSARALDPKTTVINHNHVVAAIQSTGYIASGTIDPYTRTVSDAFLNNIADVICKVVNTIKIEQ